MTTKKQEQIEEHKEPDAKDVQIAQLNARIENLEAQNSGQKNLLIQLESILNNAHELAISVIYNATDAHGNKVAAGLKLKELQDLISRNAVALSEITKEWKKE